MVTQEVNSYGYERGDNSLEIIKALPTLRKAKILNLGCGSPEQMKLIQSLGYEVKDLDAPGIAIRIYKKKQLDVIQWDLNEKLPFSDKEFDIITCIEVIEHLCDPASVLSEIKRVIKDDGILIISSPNEYDWYHRLKIFDKSIDWHPWTSTTHLHKCNFSEFIAFITGGRWSINSIYQFMLSGNQYLHKKFNNSLLVFDLTPLLQRRGYCKKTLSKVVMKNEDPLSKRHV